MTNYEAHAILNSVKLGLFKYFTDKQITQALVVTGDLDVCKVAPTVDRTLREDGIQSCYVRSSQMEYEEIEGRSYWSMDWNRRRNSSQVGGVEK